MAVAVKKKKGTKGRMTKADSFANKNYALKLYMQGMAQIEIAERCGVTPQTISDWKEKNEWDIKRAARSISLEQLANKCMQKASEMLDQPIGEFSSDAFAKAIAQLKTLLPKNTVDTDLMTFLAFQDFLLEIRNEEKIDEEFIKKVSKYQDRYIKRKMGHND
jgi:DNA-binding XRE family transcriptional regulator